jgi:shikimate dehydrogenase
MNLSGKGRLAGIMGWPVAQSLSPLLHGYWLAEHGIDGVMVPLAVRREDFGTVVRALRLAGFRGTGVTVPHKEAAFALADRCDTAALAAGAVNQLVFHDDGAIEGLNTDAFGLAASLREALGLDALKGKPAIILGAGGAARAAVLALGELGAAEIRILNRNRSRAENLAALLGPQVAARLVPKGLEDWTHAAGDIALVVQTTSAGMKGAPPLDLPLEALAPSAAICDIVYNPLETDFLKHARQSGHRCIDGLGMLMHQAVPAFHAFFGVEPKVTPALRRVLEQALADAR